MSKHFKSVFVADVQSAAHEQYRDSVITTLKDAGVEVHTSDEFGAVNDEDEMRGKLQEVLEKVENTVHFFGAHYDEDNMIGDQYSRTHLQLQESQVKFKSVEKNTDSSVLVWLDEKALDGKTIRSLDDFRQRELLYTALNNKRPVRVFCSYSHNDEAVLKKLKENLIGELKAGRIVSWDDSELKTGNDWDHEIQRALQHSDVPFYLISSGFQNSKYIEKVELPVGLEGERFFGVKLQKIILVDEIKSIQLANDGKPLLDDKGIISQNGIFDTVNELIERCNRIRAALPETALTEVMHTSFSQFMEHVRSCVPRGTPPGAMRVTNIDLYLSPSDGCEQSESFSKLKEKLRDNKYGVEFIVKSVHGELKEVVEYEKGLLKYMDAGLFFNTSSKTLGDLQIQTRAANRLKDQLPELKQIGVYRLGSEDREKMEEMVGRNVLLYMDNDEVKNDDIDDFIKNITEKIR